MFVDVDGARVRCLTGGVPFDPSKPVVVFLHGAGMEGSVWALQSRWCAHHGLAVLAPDFPAHGRSRGAPLGTIAQMAEWVVRVLDTCAASTATVVGHSMGSLVALATAALKPSRVSRLVLVGTAARMGVGPELLTAARTDSPDATAMVNLWSFGPRAGLGGSEIPGLWMAGSGHRLIEPNASTLHADLAACDTCDIEAMARAVDQPTLIVQGSSDVMTPFKSATTLGRLLKRSQIVEMANAGHMPMIEEGGRFLALLDGYLGKPPAVPAATPPVGAPP